MLHAVDVLVADAENDLEVVLLQPMLFDRRHPSTDRFFLERTRARQLVDADPDSWAARTSVDNLLTSWRSLKEDARRAGLRDRPWRGRLRIRRARRLLEEARSDRGSPAMRIRAYRRGTRLLDGLITLPEPLRRTLYEAAAQTPPARIPGPDFPTWG